MTQQWSGAIRQWSGTIQRGLGMIRQWSGTARQWSGMVQQWLGAIQQWSLVIFPRCKGALRCAPTQIRNIFRFKWCQKMRLC
ncbi:hypothetical protein H6F93_10535 [Leptolyngbya sp. FACHB-671]|uniref:hypothetical protein n=1 Tax=unclassified Leptolyngbya TaxID=2650499 RepID=UPI001682654A|nr:MULTISPECIES: hypothetical protein [unclassified Leptolyngbya]MBD2001606.1 hypothetical protein [Leptolyngbya sp. FACHB-541]MBD2067955.1 hypothetical protein [Leptolyngbya sp. FACHB-671]